MYILLSPDQIAENILERCKIQDIAVKELCRAQGIAVNTVYTMRDRGSYPRFDTLFKIASGLGCTVEDLCTYSIAEPETATPGTEHHDGDGLET